jgi:uroporphyrinogen III methyltransferase/synthase
LRQPLAELGAEILEVPTIKIVPPEAKQELADALLGLGEYQWIVFTSANGVSAFFDYFFKAFDDLRSIGGVRLAAVGPGTAAKLKELHLDVDVMPDEALGKKVAAAMNSFESVENLRILLARAERANPELPKALVELGAIVDDVGFYQTVAETDDRTGAGARLLERGADWITFTSASTVEHFHARFELPKLAQKFPRLKLASIGPETSKAILALGLKPTLEAKPHTLEGLVKALVAHAGQHLAEPSR